MSNVDRSSLKKNYSSSVRDANSFSDFLRSPFRVALRRFNL